MDTPITVNDLAQKVGVSPVSLLGRDMCTDEDLQVLSRYCDPWNLIGAHLKLTKEEISAINEENKHAALKRLEMLQKWRERNAYRATYQAYIEVLLELNNALAAYKVCQEFQKRYCQSTAHDQSMSQPSQSDSGYGSQLKLLSQQSTIAEADRADTEDIRLTLPPPSVEPLNAKDGHIVDSTRAERENLSCDTEKGVDEMDFDPPVNNKSVSSSPLRSVGPLFPSTDDPQALRERDKSLSDALKVFKLDSFLPNQERVIRNILAGISTLLIQRVGSGKSLCYQIPAYLCSQSKSHARCIALVISPLISLMEDQVRTCPAKEQLKMRCLHTNQTKQQKAKVLQELADGNINVLLLSPEALESGSFCGELGIPQLRGRLPPIAFACIDEAHCILEWSHNFRHSYFRIQKVLRESLGVQCVLGLTATATHRTALSIAKYFSVKEENIIVGDSILPKNLDIKVSQVSSEYSERDKALIDLLQRPELKECESIIIYCTTKRQTEVLTEKLNEHFKSSPRNECESDESDQDGVPCVPDVSESVKRKKSTSSSSSKQQKTNWCAASYHGGMLPFERKKVQDAFMDGRVPIIVATLAFGMGINKKNVRAVIHFNMPKSIEIFVQEIGRAGRDGEKAYSHIFIDEQKKDFYFIRRFAYESAVDPDALGQFVDKVFSSPQNAQSLDFFSQSSQNSTGDDAGQQRVIFSKEMEKLDIRQDCTATLLCYLELEGWLEITNAVYDTCTIKWGDKPEPERLNILKKEFPVVDAAVAIHQENKRPNLKYAKEMTISVKEVASHMQKKFDEVYSEFRRLKSYGQETVEQNSESEIANTVMVEFSGRIFSILSSRDFSEEKRHDIIAYLQEMMKKQEKREVEKLHLLYAVLQSATRQTCNSQSVKQLTTENLIDQYFSKQGLSIPDLRNHKIRVMPLEFRMPPEEEEKIEEDIENFLNHCKDINSPPFTATAIARIFYGIGSPLFPHETWKDQRFFWRKPRYLQIDFNKLCAIASHKINGRN